MDYDLLAGDTGGMSAEEKTIISQKQKVVIGDSLEVLKNTPSLCFDCVYIDPPYFTKRDFSGALRIDQKENGKKTLLRFSDRWKGKDSGDGRAVYLDWLGERLVEIHRVLKSDGVLLLHLDWHAVHYAKVMCDELFGDAGFQNEIIWHYQTGGASKSHFSRKHDTILFYTKGPNFYFDGKSIAIPRTEKAMKRARCATGARIDVTDTHKNPDDVLMIPALNPMSNERTGYPTQKPVELLERLVVATCPAGGLVGDFFCGSGTTLVAAKNLGREYFGCDISADAVAISLRRLEGA